MEHDEDGGWGMAVFIFALLTTAVFVTVAMLAFAAGATVLVDAFGSPATDTPASTVIAEPSVEPTASVEPTVAAPSVHDRFVLPADAVYSDVLSAPGFVAPGDASAALMMAAAAPDAVVADNAAVAAPGANMMATPDPRNTCFEPDKTCLTREQWVYGWCEYQAKHLTGAIRPGESALGCLYVLLPYLRPAEPVEVPERARPILPPPLQEG